MGKLRLVLCMALSLAALWAQADGNKGQILGTVTDPNGSVVSNASVTIKNTDTGSMRELKTDSEGNYRAVLLDPGAYEVAAKSTGFATATVQGVVLTVGGAVSANIGLKVESTTTTIEVGESLIQIALPSPSTNLTSTQITNLPILGRRFQDFATLTPAVQVDPSRGQLSFVGQRGINSNVMLDGTDYNQPFFGGIRGGERSNAAFTIPQSSIQEFQTVTSGYAAEYGRSTGGILNAITKSGGNEIRGEAFYQIRHRELSLENPIPIVLAGRTTPTKITPSETLQQYGGGAGGPFKKDRWFWFAAAEYQKVDVPRQVFFANLVGVAETPANSAALQFFKSQEGPFSQTNNAFSSMGRTDYQFNKGHHLSLRYQHSRNDAENAVSVGGALNPFSNAALSREGTERDRIHGGSAQYTHLVSSSVINDTRFSWTYELRPRESNSTLPTVGVGVIGGFGATSFLPTTQDDTRVQIVNGLSINRGAHTMKVGFDYSNLSTFQAFGFNQFGSFSINGTNVNTLLDLLSPGGAIANRFASADVANYTRQVGNLLAQYKMHQIAFYGQDSWRVNNKLTLDFGLRWEGQINPTPDTTNSALVQRVANGSYPLGKLDPGNIPNALNQWSPRFGFAWSPVSTGRRVVVRGHTGLFYAASPMILFSSATNYFRNPAGDASIQITPNTATGETVYDIFRAVGYDLNQGSLASLPIIPIDVVQRAAAYRSGLPTTGTVDPMIGTSPVVIAPGFRNPTSFQVGLGTESELFRNFVAGVQFNYVNTSRLQRNRDWNLPVPTVRAGDQRPIYSRNNRPVPTLGTYTVRESTARSMYRGMTLQAQYRVKRFQFGANYTLSETFSDSDLERDAGGVDYQNVYDLKSDYNYSRLDARHLFNTYGVVTLPWGFDLSATNRSRSGVPLNAIVGVDANTDNSNTDRPFRSPGVVFQRNAFRNRGITQTDFRLLKSFPMGERRRLQFSMEIFNVFNSENVVFNSPTGGGTVANYGLGVNADGSAAVVNPNFMLLKNAAGLYNAATTTQQSSPLQVQFGARFFF